MNQSTVFDCSIIQLPRVYNLSGSITSVNNNQEIPFDIKRVYYLYDVPGGEARGGHAHKNLQQLIVAASGSFDITVDDGNVKRTYQLSRPYMGLYLPSGLWRELDNFSSGSICLVLASLEYEERDYIRNYKIFQIYKNLRFVKYDKAFLEKSWEWLKDSEVKELTMTPDFTKREQADFFSSLPSRNDYFIKGIEYKGKPIGACGLKSITNTTAEYWGYIGEKDYWGKGIGSLIIDFIVNQSLHLELKSIYLNVNSNNLRAIKSYERYGFNIIKDGKIKTYEYMLRW